MTHAYSPTPTRLHRRLSEAASIGIFLACVGAVELHTRRLTAVGDRSAYFGQVRAALDGMPREFDEWVGVDVPIPIQAQKILLPTAFLSRRYVNRATGENCLVTIVHCGDSRDMLGHYPPNCYPGQGWLLEIAKPNDIPLSIGSIHATDYTFTRGRFGVSTIANVTNTMLLPDGTSVPDLHGVERAMVIPEMRYHGVAQVQVFFDGAVPDDRRQQVVREMLEAHRACITAVVRAPNIR